MDSNYFHKGARVIGAIIGDIAGSTHEFTGTKTKDFPLVTSRSTYTDDTVLSVAVADWLLTGKDLTDLLHSYYHLYPERGYGGMFHQWARTRNRSPYNSYGNGSAMRASAVGFAFETIDEVLLWAERSASVTHNHPEGIKGAQATAAAIYYARRTSDRQEIRRLLESRFNYDLSRNLDQIRPSYAFNGTCQGTVPEAIVAFLESTSYEDAIRNAISLGGDADTLACITGGIAEAFYGIIPDELILCVKRILSHSLMEVIRSFYRKFGSEHAAAILD